MLGGFVGNLYGQREKMFSSKFSVAQVRKIEGASVGMSVCANATADVEALLGPGDSTDSVLELLQGLTDSEVTVKPRQTPYLQGYQFKAFPHQEIIGQIIRDFTGSEMETEFRSSVGDDNVFGAYLGIPTITWGPIGFNEHRSLEHVSINSLDMRVEMYRKFLAEINSH